MWKITCLHDIVFASQKTERREELTCRCFRLVAKMVLWTPLQACQSYWPYFRPQTLQWTGMRHRGEYCRDQMDIWWARLEKKTVVIPAALSMTRNIIITRDSPIVRSTSSMWGPSIPVEGWSSPHYVKSPKLCCERTRATLRLRGCCAKIPQTSTDRYSIEYIVTLA
jgi:hypothetical protein